MHMREEPLSPLTHRVRGVQVCAGLHQDLRRRRVPISGRQMKGGVPGLREAARATHAKRDKERKTENTSMK